MLVGSNRSARPNRARQPAVKPQFSPLMSWTIAEPGQVSSVGTTRPTPLPERVGAKHSTCSGPWWRRLGAAPATEQNAVGMQQARALDLARLGPVRGPIGRHLLH